jgi:hypothetical protein
MSYTKIQTVYSDRATPNDCAVHAAVTAVLNLECKSPVVILALDTLVGAYEAKADEPEVERLERYVAECWAEHKGEVQS